MDAIGFIIGTVVIIFGGQFITVPLCKALARQQGKDPNRLYMPIDVALKGVIGFGLGFFMHSPFIGISLSQKGWPGMVAFIAASFAGAHLGAM